MLKAKMKKTTSVSLVIVDYDGKRYLKKCLDSIADLNFPKKNLTVIVVENSTKNAPVDYVRKNYPTVNVLINKENNYALANNLGADATKSDYIGFLNNDIVCDKDWLKHLINAMEKDESIGISGGKIFLPNGRLQSTGHEEYPNFYFGDRGFKEKDKGQYDKSEEMVSLCGAAILVRRKSFVKVGGYDAFFHQYFEEVDLAYRVKKAGWKVIYVPKSRLTHEYMGSFTSNIQKRYVERNRLLYVTKHFPEKLPEALSTSQYFYIDKSYTLIFSILSDVLAVLRVTHPKKEIKIVPEIFESLRKIVQYEKNAIIAESDLSNTLSLKDKIIDSLKDELIELQRDYQKVQSENAQVRRDIATIKGQLSEKMLIIQNQQMQFAEDEKRYQRQLQHIQNIDIKNLKSALIEKESQITSMIEKSKMDAEMLEAEKQKADEFKQDLDKHRMMLLELRQELKASQDVKNDLMMKLKHKHDELKELRGSIPYKLIMKPIDSVTKAIKPSPKKKLLKSR